MPSAHNHLFFLQIPQDVACAAEADKWAFVGLRHLPGLDLGTRDHYEAPTPQNKREER